MGIWSTRGRVSKNEKLIHILEKRRLNRDIWSYRENLPKESCFPTWESNLSVKKLIPGKKMRGERTCGSWKLFISTLSEGLDSMLLLSSKCWIRFFSFAERCIFLAWSWSWWLWRKIQQNGKDWIWRYSTWVMSWVGDMLCQWVERPLRNMNHESNATSVQSLT
jgi:hypothetical protein